MKKNEEVGRMLEEEVKSVVVVYNFKGRKKINRSERKKSVVFSKCVVCCHNITRWFSQCRLYSLSETLLCVWSGSKKLTVW